MEFYPSFEFKISFKIFLFAAYYLRAGDNNLTFRNFLMLISHKSTGLKHENGPPLSDTLSSVRNRTWTQHCLILPLELWHLVPVHVILGQHSSLSQTEERFHRAFPAMMHEDGLLTSDSSPPAVTNCWAAKSNSQAFKMQIKKVNRIFL